MRGVRGVRGAGPGEVSGEMGEVVDAYCEEGRDWWWWGDGGVRLWWFWYVG